ncbi:hypothetical protein K2Q02_01240 [Patescibacteria group bacterium]|nr:hypothetical protein [Patescibacteria group bacterium]
MGSYAISFHGFSLTGAVTVLTPVDELIPAKQKDRFEMFKHLANQLRREVSISATVAYIKKRTKKTWVTTKIGKKKYPILVFLTKKNDTCIITRNNELVINGTAHHHYVPYEQFEAIPIYPD